MDYIKDLHDYNMDEPKEVKEFFGVNAIDRLKGVVSEIIDNEQWNLVEYATDIISDTAARRATNFLEKILKGDEDACRALLGGEGSRYRQMGADKGEPWAKMIHGSLHLTQEVKIRNAIVEAHSDLIRDEHTKDLESVIDGLKGQVIRLESDLERMRERL